MSSALSKSAAAACASSVGTASHIMVSRAALDARARMPALISRLGASEHVSVQNLVRQLESLRVT